MQLDNMKALKYVDGDTVIPVADLCRLIDRASAHNKTLIADLSLCRLLLLAPIAFADTLYFDSMANATLHMLLLRNQA